MDKTRERPRESSCIFVNGQTSDAVSVKTLYLQFVGTVAFQAVLDEYTTISVGTVLIFNDVDLNLGDGYAFVFTFSRMLCSKECESARNFYWFILTFS